MDDNIWEYPFGDLEDDDEISEVSLASKYSSSYISASGISVQRYVRQNRMNLP